jgi:hypothetical protein
MSVLKYNELLSEMKKEVCEELSRKGFGEYRKMLCSLGMGMEEENVDDKGNDLDGVCVEDKENDLDGVCVEDKENDLEGVCVEDKENDLEGVCVEDKENVEELEKEEYIEDKESVCVEDKESVCVLEKESVCVLEKESVCVLEKEECVLEKENVLSVEVKKKDVNSKVMLPWCEHVLSDRCKAIVSNGGLYTQCMKVSESYCKGCVTKKEKNGDEFVYGTVEDRLRCGLLEYKDKKGKSEVLYSSVMKKECISREEAEEAANKLGWVIPECYFEVKESKRGRPKKNVEKDESVEKKSRGRPKKEKETVVGNVGEDLIASLIEKKLELEENVELEKNVDLEENVELEKNVELEENDSVDEEESEEECEVTKFEHNGKCYLKSGDNVLFDIESHDYVGMWNGSSIDEIEEEE